MHQVIKGEVIGDSRLLFYREANKLLLEIKVS